MTAESQTIAGQLPMLRRLVEDGTQLDRTTVLKLIGQVERVAPLEAELANWKSTAVQRGERIQYLDAELGNWRTTAMQRSGQEPEDAELEAEALELLSRALYGQRDVVDSWEGREALKPLWIAAACYVRRERAGK